MARGDPGRGGARRAGWLVAVLTILSVPSIAAAQTNGGDLSLEGARTVLTGSADEPAFSDPTYDDSGWSTVSIPAGLRQLGVPEHVDVAWYRIHFRLPAGWNIARPAISLGLVTRADETYLNGIRIGGEGTVGPLGTDFHNYAPNLPRLYQFDPAILVADGDNVLAIRVGRQPYIDDGGLVAGPVALVDYRSALAEYLSKLMTFVSFDNFFLGIQTVTLLIPTFAVWGRSRDRAVFSFFGLYLFAYLGTLENRYVVHFAGFNAPWLQVLATISYNLSLPILIEFVALVFNRPVGRIGRLVQIGALAVAVNVPFAGFAPTDWWRVESNLVWRTCLSIGFGLMLYWTVVGIFRRQRHAIPMMLGVLTMATCIVIDITWTTVSTEATYGFFLSDVGVIAFQLSLAFVAGQRVFEMERAVEAANVKILTAHEQERSRLARDIHDGIGQWLSLIKLKLNLVKTDFARQNLPSEPVDRLVDDVGRAIEDTRRIAHDLSPVLLKEHGLVAAMRSHIDSLARRSDIKVSLEAPAELPLPDQVRDHVYRIFQEALRNALDHSASEHIAVTLSASRSRLLLQIEDDGIGIVAKSGGGPDSHLGLKTMSERASLLGGRLLTRSGDGGGTSISVEVPI